MNLPSRGLLLNPLFKARYLPKILNFTTNIMIIRRKIFFFIWPVSHEGLCNNYLEGGGGVGKLEGGIGENDNKREGGLDVKFNTYRRGITIFIPFCKLEKWWKSY